MLAVFKNAEDSAFKAYEAAASGLWSDYDFAHTFDASLVEEVGTLVLAMIPTFPHASIQHD